MFRKREFQIDWSRLRVAIVVGIGSLCIPVAVALNHGDNTTPESSGPILTAQLPVSSGVMTEQGILPKAFHLYLQAVEELHRGQAVSAEKYANRAAALDVNFADAKALAATAALAQRQFLRAREEADDAVHRNRNDEKAWVALATADNYLGKYAEAIDALSNVREQNRVTWQVAYEWARAEAGRNDAAQTLEWSNRAALNAPSDFAPLHLLRASALLAASRYLQSANELDTYLRLINKNAPEREGLTQELRRLRELAQSASKPLPATAEFNAPAN